MIGSFVGRMVATEFMEMPGPSPACFALNRDEWASVRDNFKSFPGNRGVAKATTPVFIARC